MKIIVAGDGEAPPPTWEETTTVTIPAVIPDAVDADVPETYQSGQLATMRLASPTAGSIDASWTAPTTPTYQTPTTYELNWAKDQETYPTSTAASGFIQVAGTSYSITGVEHGETYRVRARAVYAQIPATAWNGPWTELEIISSTAELTNTITTLVPVTEDEPESAAQSSAPTRPLSAQAQTIPNDGAGFQTYTSRIWVVSQHDAVQLSWKRPTASVGYRIWRAPAGDSAYTQLIEISDPSSISQPSGGLGSRFYYSDTTVAAATEYKYAVQVLDSGAYSAPYEALASTTQWLPTRDTQTAVEQPIPTNDDGDFLLDVGDRVKATVFQTTETTNYVLTLQAGEAYRIELYDLFARDGGHEHEISDAGNAGPIQTESDANDATPTHTHGTHIKLQSIVQVSSDDSVPFEDRDFRTLHSADWPVFWNTNLLESCCFSEDLSYVSHAPSAEEYKVRVRTDYGPVRYEIRVAKLGDQPDIPSYRQRQSFQTRGSTTWGHSAATIGNIGVDDKDWFNAKLEPTKTYRITLAVGNDLDWQELSNVRFFSMAGPDGVQVRPPYDGAVRDRFRFAVPHDEGGYYHFGVSGASASDRGLYVISIVEADFPTNPNALVIAIGQQIIGMIESSNDRDWIGAHLTAGQKYRATASSSYGNINGRTFAIAIDLKAAVYNQDGTRLSPGDAFSMDPGDDLNTGRVASATYTANASGLHFFEVIQSDRTGRTRGAYYFTITEVSQ